MTSIYGVDPFLTTRKLVFTPKVFGEQWEKGAISQGIWKGVSFKTLLLATGVKENSQEVVFEGYEETSNIYFLF